MADWIPNRELEAMQFMLGNAAYAAANAVVLGLPTSRANLYLSRATAYQDAVAVAEAAMDTARSLNEAKTLAGALAEELAREIAGYVQGSATVSDEERLAGGWPIRDRSRTPVPPPSETPVLSVNTKNRLQHVIRVGFGAGTSRAKPPGTTGYGIWAKVGGETAPTDLTGCTFLAIATRNTFTATYAGADGGKTAWYIAACLNGKGERGPLSETVAATIAA